MSLEKGHGVFFCGNVPSYKVKLPRLETKVLPALTSEEVKTILCACEYEQGNIIHVGMTARDTRFVPENCLGGQVARLAVNQKLVDFEP